MDIYTEKHLKYNCEKCAFQCKRKPDWNRHLDTAKHQKMINVNSLLMEKAPPFICGLCSKEYHSTVGLWKHKKKCNMTLDASNNEIKVLTNLVLELVKNNSELQKQHQDFQKQILDISQKIQPTTINTNSNNNNKTFNLQLFLNEECKDAMNMSDFIKSIELQLVDLENFAEMDYTEGMSKLIIKQLRNTDLYKRPVHCSDAKRETLYIKEENKWEKEGPENKKMIGAVRAVDKKNIDLLFKWKDAHPTCLNTDSQYNDQYIKLLHSVVSGSEENVNKVIKKLTKEVVIMK